VSRRAITPVPRRAIAPVAGWRAFMPVLMMPVAWRRRGRFVINPVPAAFITIMLVPPTRWTPVTTIPIVSAVVTVSDMQ
jgi:hypothetical protein